MRCDAAASASVADIVAASCAALYLTLLCFCFCLKHSSPFRFRSQFPFFSLNFLPARISHSSLALKVPEPDSEPQPARRGLAAKLSHSLTSTNTLTLTLILTHTYGTQYVSPPDVWGRSICRHLFTRLEIDFMRFDNISNVEKKFTTIVDTYLCTYVCIYCSYVHVCV